jgi:prophage tail gpP-like protein
LEANPGETVFAFIERIARPRGAVFAPDHLGNFLLIGDHDYQPVYNLVEGQNILRMQVVFTNEGTFKDVRTIGQSGGDNQQNMTGSSELEGNSGGWPNMPYSPILVPAEQPVWGKGELMARAHHEDIFDWGTYITANVTVQGWLRGGTALWMPGDKVTVWSPMAPFLGTELKIRTATFTQDSESGTVTLLELVAPWMLRDTMNADPTGIVPNAPAKNQQPTPAPTPAPVEYPAEQLPPG